jgi:hypothetical protein
MKTFMATVEIYGTSTSDGVFERKLEKWLSKMPTDIVSAEILDIEETDSFELNDQDSYDDGGDE